MREVLKNINYTVGSLLMGLGIALSYPLYATVFILTFFVEPEEEELED